MRSRRILSSASTSGPLRRSRAFSCCISSPMAKYASCRRAQGPQKATPKISTSALREQGLSVLLRTWQRPGFVVASVKATPLSENLLDSLFEGVARAEGRNLLGRDLHFLPGLGVSALPGLALLNGELPEARDLDLLATLKRLGHHLLEGLEVLLCLALGYTGLLCDPLDEVLLLHDYSFLWSSSASWRACLVCLLPLYKGAGNACHPLGAGGFSGTDVVGACCGTYTTFGTASSGRRPGRLIP